MVSSTRASSVAVTPRGSAPATPRDRSRAVSPEQELTDEATASTAAGAAVMLPSIPPDTLFEVMTSPRKDADWLEQFKPHPVAHGYDTGFSFNRLPETPQETANINDFELQLAASMPGDESEEEHAPDELAEVVFPHASILKRWENPSQVPTAPTSSAHVVSLIMQRRAQRALAAITAPRRAPLVPPPPKPAATGEISTISAPRPMVALEPRQPSSRPLPALHRPHPPKPTFSRQKLRATIAARVASMASQVATTLSHDEAVSIAPSDLPTADSELLRSLDSAPCGISGDETVDAEIPTSTLHVVSTMADHMRSRLNQLVPPLPSVTEEDSTPQIVESPVVVPIVPASPRPRRRYQPINELRDVHEYTKVLERIQQRMSELLGVNVTSRVTKLLADVAGVPNPGEESALFASLLPDDATLSDSTLFPLSPAPNNDAVDTLASPLDPTAASDSVLEKSLSLPRVDEAPAARSVHARTSSVSFSASDLGPPKLQRRSSSVQFSADEVSFGGSSAPPTPAPESIEPLAAAAVVVAAAADRAESEGAQAPPPPLFRKKSIVADGFRLDRNAVATSDAVVGAFLLRHQMAFPRRVEEGEPVVDEYFEARDKHPLAFCTF